MKRYDLLDTIRGIALINMILYHGIWDLVYLFHVNWQWYYSTVGYLWQQSICWTFILLSGFCWPLGKKHFQRGMFVFAAGIIITVATALVMPSERIVFGILTMIGSSMLLMIFFHKYLHRIRSLTGISISFVLFVFTRNINNGYLGFEHWNFVKLPDILYANGITAYLGFPGEEFYSTDYFSLFPWFFLYLTGYFLYRISEKRNWNRFLKKSPLTRIQKIGKHSLEIYLLHQPILYIGLNCIFGFL